MTEPYVRATRYIVNVIPDSIGVYAQLFEITVERRGLTHRWAVVRHDQYLSSNGVWDDAPRASEREDGWLDEHRFDLDTALRLANEAAPHVTVKGRTAAEALARLIATGRIAPSTLRRMADEAQQPEGEDAGPRCRYCGADCSNGRSYDGGDRYACPDCARDRAAVNAAGGRFDGLLSRLAPASGPGRVADEEPAETQEGPRTVCVCGHTKGEHLAVSGRLLCDACDPDSTDNLVCTGFDAL